MMTLNNESNQPRAILHYYLTLYWCGGEHTMAFLRSLSTFSLQLLYNIYSHIYNITVPSALFNTITIIIIKQ